MINLLLVMLILLLQINMETVEMATEDDKQEIKKAKEYIESQMNLSFLKDETKITMTNLYSSLNEKNARKIVRMSSQFVQEDMRALSAEDVIRLTNKNSSTKRFMMGILIIILSSSIGYLIDFGKTFRDVLIRGQLFLLLLFLACSLSFLYRVKILDQGHWNQ
jgi:uncharacterized protein YpuA (DUF1002 family)